MVTPTGLQFDKGNKTQYIYITKKQINKHF